MTQSSGTDADVSSSISYLTTNIVTVLLVVIIGSIWLTWTRKDSKGIGQVPEGCYKLGLTGPGNLGDEHDLRYSHQDMPGVQTGWRVKSLWIYPVKSCRGIELNSGAIVGTGMQYDRQFAFARYIKTSGPDEPDAYGWKFVTQREAPKIATVKPEVWVPETKFQMSHGAHSHAQSGGVLLIKYPTKGGRERSIQFPLNPTKSQIKYNGYRTQRMTIWRDSPEALLMASTESQDSWMQDIQSLLGFSAPVALFRVSNMHAREVFRCAPRQEEIGWQPSVGFQDAYPLHILNLASVRDVASRTDLGRNELSIKNFRPNIIVTGGAPYAEDNWKLIKIGEDQYHVSCRTTRCLLPNVNQETGERRQEPYKTMKSFRIVDEGAPSSPCLGMQMVPASEDERMLCVGDEITVLATGAHKYIKI